MNSLKSIFILSFAVKLILSLCIPLLPDEAYYWVWGFHLDWSYYDHPVMPGALGWLGEQMRSALPFFGPGIIRFPSLVLCHISLWFWLLLFREVTEKKSQDLEKLWLVLMLVHPFFGIGSFILTPDIPLLFFWPLSFLIFARALKNESPLYYSLLGGSLGLGFISKYHTVLAIPVILGSLLYPRIRNSVQWRWVPLTLLFGLIAASPVFYWNSQNNWLSFQFQLNHGLGKPDWDPWWTWSYFVGQVLLLSPFLVLSFLRACRANVSPIVILQALLPWGFFFLTSFRSAVEANWPIIAFPCALWLGVYGVKKAWTYTASVALWIFVCSLLLLQVFLPIDSMTNIKILELKDVKSFSRIAAKYEPLYGGSYQLSSLLWLNLNKPVYKIFGMNRMDFFDTLDESMPSTYPFYIARTKDQGLPARLLYDFAVSVQLIESMGNYQIIKVDKK